MKVHCPYCQSRNEVPYIPVGGRDFLHCQGCQSKIVVENIPGGTYVARCNDGDHDFRPEEGYKCHRCGLLPTAEAVLH